ncbi:MAG: hypothetical protein FWF08_02865 [Oscillospiraceae bacterium]|nr:hypothetical protein [Oscillospiraceae bacterium]
MTASHPRISARIEQLETLIENEHVPYAPAPVPYDNRAYDGRAYEDRAYDK